MRTLSGLAAVIPPPLGRVTVGADHARPSELARGLPSLSWLEAEGGALIAQALDAGRDRRSFVLVLSPEEGASIESRAALAARLRAAGLSRLARDVARAPVPTSHILALVDAEGVTELRAVPIAVTQRAETPDQAAAWRAT